MNASITRVTIAVLTHSFILPSHFNFTDSCTYISTQVRQICKYVDIARKTRVEQHLPDWANWLVLYPPWICCRDCTKLPSFSHSTIPLARVMRSRVYSGKHIHMYPRYFKIDEYFSLSYRFRDKFKVEFFLFGNFVNGTIYSKFFRFKYRKHSCIIK